MLLLMKSCGVAGTNLDGRRACAGADHRTEIRVVAILCLVGDIDAAVNRPVHRLEGYFPGQCRWQRCGPLLVAARLCTNWSSVRSRDKGFTAVQNSRAVHLDPCVYHTYKSSLLFVSELKALRLVDHGPADCKSDRDDRQQRSAAVSSRSCA